MIGIVEPSRRSYRLAGLKIEDPYLWLEADSPETEDWERDQELRTEAMLAGTSGSLLAARIRPHIDALWRFAPRPGGDCWFRLVRDTERLIVTVAAGPGAAERWLLDPADHGYTSVEWFAPSPRGTLLACGLARDGQPDAELRIFDVASGELLGDRIPFASGCRPAWLPDEDGFYYNAGSGPHRLDQRIALHRLGGPQRPPEPLPAPFDGLVLPQISSDGSAVAALEGFATPRPTFLKLGDGGWQPFLDEFEGMALGVLEADAYLAVVATTDHPNGRIVSIPLSAGHDQERWIELVPESDAVLRAVARVAGRLVVSAVADGEVLLQVYSAEGRRLAVADLPPRGAIAVDGLSWSHAPLEEQFTAGEREIVFVHGSYTRSPSLWRYDIDALTLSELEPPLFEHDEFQVERCSASSSDGAAVPMTLVSRTDLDRAEPHPCVIYPYGGSNNAFLPVYLGALTAFVEDGGIVVFPSIRGGGELGLAWYLQGRLERKQQCFQDLRAVARWLVESGVTRRDLLGAIGISAGGLLVGSSLATEPQMCAAAVLLVPLLDLVRIGDGAYDKYIVTEHGDPADPETVAQIVSYSPYHNVGEGEYPELLVVCGDADTTCPPRHARKYVARMQERASAKRSVYFRKWPGAGHLAGEVPTAEQGAEWVSFLMTRLGLASAGA